MNREQKRPQRVVRNPAYRKALERIDEYLQRHDGGASSEALERIRQALFGPLPEYLENPGATEPPHEGI